MDVTDQVDQADETIDEVGDASSADTAPLDEPPVDEARDGEELDLGLIERDLDGVSAALERLDAGTYWTDEVTGEHIPDEVLAADPVARRAT